MWRFFSYETDPMLACPCGQCDNPQGMDSEFMRKLDNLRAKLNVPIQVNSGYRCPAHNAIVSTTGEDGPHTTGRAVDVALIGSRVWDAMPHFKGMGFYGIGLRQAGDHDARFVHLDDLEAAETHGPRPWVWTYPA